MNFPWSPRNRGHSRAQTTVGGLTVQVHDSDIAQAVADQTNPVILALSRTLDLPADNIRIHLGNYPHITVVKRGIERQSGQLSLKTVRWVESFDRTKTGEPFEFIVEFGTAI